MMEKLGGSFENEVRGPPVVMNPRPPQNQNPNIVPGPDVIDDSSEEDSDDKTDDDEAMEQDNDETDQAPNAATQIENRNNESFELFFRDASDSDSD